MMRLEYFVDGCYPLSASSPASRYASSAPLRVELQRTPLKCWSSNVGVCWVGQGFKDTIWCCIKQTSVCVLSTLEDQTNIYTVFTTSSVVRTVASLLQQIVLQVFPETFFKQVENVLQENRWVRLSHFRCLLLCSGFMTTADSAHGNLWSKLHVDGHVCFNGCCMCHDFMATAGNASRWLH